MLAGQRLLPSPAPLSVLLLEVFPQQEGVSRMCASTAGCALRYVTCWRALRVIDYCFSDTKVWPFF